MGWLFQHMGKGQAGAHFKKQLTWETEEKSNRLLKGAFKGFNEYYGAVEVTDKASGSRYVFAVCCMIKWVPNDPHYNFGYKDMDETMGPYMYNCPQTILDLLTETPCDNDSSREWRRICNERNASRLVPKDGDVIKLKGTMRFRGGWDLDTFIVEKHGRRTTYYSVDNRGNKIGYNRFLVKRNDLIGATVIAQKIPEVKS